MDSVESAEKERSKLELFAEKSKREWEREHNHIQEEADRVKSELENTQRQLEEVITTTKKVWKMFNLKPKCPAVEDGIQETTGISSVGP